MRAVACVWLLLASLVGCFVADPLNKPPTVIPTCEFADGRPCDGNSAVQRGDRIRLHMIVSDPDGNEDESTYGWKAFACDADGGKLCAPQPYDAQHYDEQRATGIELEIPATLGGDVRSISLDFEVRDDRGGIAVAFMVFRVIAAATLGPPRLGAPQHARCVDRPCGVDRRG